ncbi:acetolactate synthase large subunit, partial [Staphylococcus aureus]
RPVLIDFPKDMVVLPTNVHLSDEIKIPGKEVVTEPENKDNDTFISLLKEAKKPDVLAGAGINQSKSNQLLTQFLNKHQI